MRILITGGAGFIGGHLSRTFHERGDRVEVLDNLATGSLDNVPHGARLHTVDLRDALAVREVFQSLEPEVVLHHAAQADVRRSMDDPAYDADVNLKGTLNLLEAARQHGTRRFVFASTGGAVYGEPRDIPVAETTLPFPLSCYGASKASAEHYLQVYSAIHGLRTTILRYANVYGPRQNPKGEAGVVAIFSLLLLEGRQPTIFGDGSKTRDYVFIDDVVRANLLAVDGQTDGLFNIGTGVATSDQRVFEAVRDAAGLDLEPIYADRRPGEVEHIALDASHAAKHLGWRPEVAFDEGVRRAFNFYKEQYRR